MAATSADTFPAIGAQGLDVFAASRTGTLTELAPNLAKYRAAYASAGHAGKGGVFFRVPVYVADTFDRAVEDCRESILAFYRQLGEELERSAQDAGRAPSSSAMCAADGCARRPSTRCCEKS